MLRMQQRISGVALAVNATLAAALGIGILFWPYPKQCGVGLGGYLVAVGVVTLGGLWSSVWTWRHRTARAHVLSLLLVVWGILLGALEILPHAGYAKPEVPAYRVAMAYHYLWPEV